MYLRQGNSILSAFDYVFVVKTYGTTRPYGPPYFVWSLTERTNNRLKYFAASVSGTLDFDAALTRTELAADRS